jgi:hypothetical protein
VASVAVVFALAGWVYASGALACSCAPTSPARLLAESDAAISGRLLAVEPRGATRSEYRYEVVRVYRGRAAIPPGSTLAVLSPRGAGACALPDRLGRRYGLFLLGHRGRWSSGRCGVVSPRRLGVAAQGSGAGGPARPSLSLC